MARRMTNKVKSFDLNEAPVIAENERILEKPVKTVPAASEPQKEIVQPAPITNQVAAPQMQAEQIQTIPERQQSSVTQFYPSKSRKSEKGFVIELPMDLYTELVRMKLETGYTLKALSVQAIAEFVQRHK